MYRVTKAEDGHTIIILDPGTKITVTCSRPREEFLTTYMMMETGAKRTQQTVECCIRAPEVTSKTDDDIVGIRLPNKSQSEGRRFLPDNPVVKSAPLKVCAMQRNIADMEEHPTVPMVFYFQTPPEVGAEVSLRVMFNNARSNTEEWWSGVTRFAKVEGVNPSPMDDSECPYATHLLLIPDRSTTADRGHMIEQIAARRRKFPQEPRNPMWDSLVLKYNRKRARLAKEEEQGGV